MRPARRAALIALAVAWALIDGLPIPKAERAALLSPALVPVVERVAAVQTLILTPFRPLSQLFALTERWQLFAGASSERSRLEVAARSAKSPGWRLLYRADDARHRFGATLIESRSVRGAWNPRTQEPPAGYAAFVSLIARRAFVARPELREVRVRLERIHILDGGRGYVGTGTFVHEQTRSRRDVGR